jgi:hypothetical protein
MALPSLLVLYGQPANLSTSFQTQCLAEALASHFDIRHRRVMATEGHRSQQLIRVLSNVVYPVLRPIRTDYALYANDGFVDLRRIQGTKLLYWYDAPKDWVLTPPAPWQYVSHTRYNNVKSADYVFAVSQVQVQTARALRGERADAVVYLPVGVDTREFTITGADPERIKERFGIPRDRIVVG